MKKRADPEKPAQLWLNTFSDLMNLLLCFFVLLFAMSNVDQEKFQELSASLSAAFNVLPSGGSAINNDGILVGSGASQLNAIAEQYNNMGLDSDGDYSQEQEESKDAFEEVEKAGLEESEKMADAIEDALKEANVLDEVEITATSKYVELNLGSGILFDSGRAELKSEAVNLIEKVADAIYQYNDNLIIIEGHTDNVPINTAEFPDNMMLSQKRAYSVFKYLVNNKGFDPATMMSSGRGESVPIASNSTADGRAQNRRVEIKIYNTSVSYTHLTLPTT